MTPFAVLEELFRHLNSKKLVRFELDFFLEVRLAFCNLNDHQIDTCWVLRECSEKKRGKNLWISNWLVLPLLLWFVLGNKLNKSVAYLHLKPSCDTRFQRYLENACGKSFYHLRVRIGWKVSKKFYGIGTILIDSLYLFSGRKKWCDCTFGLCEVKKPSPSKSQRKY